MAKDINLDDFDFENDKDFQFGEDIEGLSEGPASGKDRNAVTSSLKDASKGFMEGITDDKMETFKSVMKNAVPREIRSEQVQAFDIYENFKIELDRSGREMKTNAKAISRVVDKYIPKGGRSERIFNKIKDKFGLNEESSGYREQSTQSRAASEVNNTLGAGTNYNDVKTLIEKNIESKRSRTALELGAATVANVEQLNAFNNQIANAYYRKSLELQFRSLYQSGEQYTLTKQAFETFRNQLETIVKNTSLPDVVKANRSEALRTQLNRIMADKLFNNRSAADNIKRNVKDFLQGITSNLNDKMDMINGMGEQTEMLNNEGFEELGFTKSRMAGGVVADYAKEFLGKQLGKFYGKSKSGQKLISNVKDAFIDPGEYFAQQADKTSGIMSKAMSMMSSMTSNQVGVNNIDLNRGDMNEATVFDRRAHTSLIKVIPGYLSKILQEVQGLRTGSVGDELRYNYETDEFKTRTQMKRDLNKKVRESVNSSNVVSYIDGFYKYLAGNTGIKLDKTGIQAMRKGLMSYAYSGKTILPTGLKRNGFYSYFPKDIASKMEKSITSLLNEKDNERRNTSVRILTDYLKTIHDNAPMNEADFRKYADSGNIDILREENYFNLKDGREQFNADILKNKHLGAISNTIVDEELAATKQHFRSLKMNGKIVKTYNTEAGYTQTGQPFSPYTDFNNRTYYKDDPTYGEKLYKMVQEQQKAAAEFIQKVNEGKIDESSSKLKKMADTSKNIYNHVREEDRAEVIAKTNELYNEVKKTYDKTKSYGQDVYQEEAKDKTSFYQKTKSIFSRLKRDIGKKKKETVESEEFKNTINDLESKADSLKQDIKKRYQSGKNKVRSVYKDKVSEENREKIDKVASTLSSETQKMKEEATQAGSSVYEKGKTYYENNVSEETRDNIEKRYTNIQDNIKDFDVKKVYDESNEFVQNKSKREEELSRVHNAINDIKEKGNVVLDETSSKLRETKELLAIKVFVGEVNLQIKTVERFMNEKASPINKSEIDNQIRTLRSKIERLLASKDTSEMKQVMIDGIKEDLGTIVRAAMPESSMNEKMRKANEKVDTEEEVDEETSAFFKVVTSNDPIGTMESMVKNKIKRSIFRGAKWLITTPFKLGKKLIQKDAALGRKLRGFLGDTLKGKSILNAPFNLAKRGGNRVLQSLGNAIYGEKGEKVRAKTERMAENTSSGFMSRLNFLIHGPSALHDNFKDKGNKAIKGLYNLFTKGKQDKEKSNPFDRDGSGERDGSWKDRFKMFYGKKKEKEENKDIEKKTEDTDESNWFQWLPMIASAALAMKRKLFSLVSDLGPMFTKAIAGLGTTMVSGFTDAVSWLLKPFSGIFKLLGLGGMETAKVGMKAAGEIGAKAAGKQGIKTLGKTLLKKIPGIGALAGLGFGIKSFLDGDVVGGFGNIASGLVSMIPGIGTVGSLAIDGWLASRDKPDEDKATTQTTDNPSSKHSVLGKTYDYMFGSDDESKPRDATNNRKGTKAPTNLPIRGGAPYPPDGGFRYLVLGKGVNVNGFNPEMASNLASMANEYYALTGKMIPINSGYRSTQEQVRLRAKLGNRAAKPGRSLHEFGLAFDTNKDTADELDKLGLLRKYGFTRPVGKEGWHVEPAGIQSDINGSKQDPEYAASLIAQGYGRGGDGWGTVSNANKYTRDGQYQADVMGAASKVIQDVKPNLPPVETKPDSKLTTSPDTESTPSDMPDQKSDSLNKQLLASNVKASGDVAKNTHGTNQRLDKMVKALSDQAAINAQILDVMKKQQEAMETVAKKDMNITVKADAPQQESARESVDQDAVTTATGPVIDVRRKKYS